MNARLLACLLASTLLVFAGTDALGMAITPAPLKIIATVVAHAHAPSQEYAVNNSQVR